MKQSLLCVFFLLGFFHQPLFSQTNHFPTPAALRDSVLAYDYLSRAQQHLDTSQTEAAVIAARAAERILRRYVDEKSSCLTDAYCLQGIALVRSERATAFALWQKVLAMPMPAEPLSQANAYYFFGICHLFSKEYPQAREAYQKALNLYLAEPGRPHTNVGRIYSNLGFIADQPGTAEDFFQKAIAAWTTHYGPLFPGLASPYNNRGLLYWNQSRYDEAYADYSKALRLRVKYLPPGHPDIAATLNNIGLIAYERGALEIAQKNYLQALSIFQRDKDSVKISAAVNNLGMVRQRQLAYADARQYFQQTLAIEQSRPQLDTAEIAKSLFNIATTYRDESQYETALNYFNQALKLFPTGHPQYAQLLNATGNAYEGQQRYAEALDYYNQAYRVLAANYNERHPAFAQILFNKANILKAQGDLAGAMELNRKGQQTLGYTGGRKFDKVLLLFDLCTLLAQESWLLYLTAAPHNDEAGLRKALASAQDALFAYEHFSRINHEPSERQVAKAAALSTAEVAISAHYHLFQVTHDTAHWREAFHHSERSKSILMLESMRITRALKTSEVDSNLLRQEHDLLESIAALDILRQNTLAQTANPTDSSIVQISLQRAALYEQHEALMQRIVQQYPKVGKALYGLRTVSVQTVQDSILLPNQSLLEYFVGDSSVFVFLIKKGSFLVREVKKDKAFPLEQWVQDMTQNGILGNLAPTPARPKISATAARNNYARAASNLYQKLVAPVAAQLSPQVIIIPDAGLNYIPFEALLTQKPSVDDRFADFQYLIQQHRISYCYSTTLLHTMRQKQHLQAPTNTLLGMAPFFRGDTASLLIFIDSTDAEVSRGDSLGALKHSGEEVARVAKDWKGTAYYGSDASVQRFRTEAPKFRILHLSTHGKADDRADDYAYLAFGVPGHEAQFDKLYARDLNFDLNTDLVVLSACETGTGKNRRGEGVVSLARAFASAGAKSLLTTLWSVQDEQTKKIMVLFYQQLNKGADKSEALWRAKRDYIRNAESSKANPYYWAGLIGIGDMRARK